MGRGATKICESFILKVHELCVFSLTINPV
jgi:hypothetical protein